MSAQDTIKKYPERYGLRVGVDLHRLAKSFYDDNYKYVSTTLDIV